MNENKAAQPQASPRMQPAEDNPIVLYNGPITGKTEIAGLEFDFNYGARIKVPEGNWRVKIMDRDAELTLYDGEVSSAVVSSTKKYYVNFRIEVYREDTLILEHNLNLRGKKVLIHYPVGVLEESIACFPYAREFQRLHGCEVYCAVAPEIADLFKATYQELHFIGSDERPDDCYASYYMGSSFSGDDRIHQPVDARVVSLQKNSSYILGVQAKEIRPAINSRQSERVVKEPYVCIGAQAASQAQYWTNPAGWLKTVEYLKNKGYRVLCIDREMYHGSGSYWNIIPYGTENFTGPLPLAERAALLYYADFFIGLSGGLSWLAWAVGCPVVMISGSSLPLHEFYTPYRVINYHVCNGCRNDTSIEFECGDFSGCPRHKNTERQFECTRFITTEQVKAAIDRLMKDHGIDPKRAAGSKFAGKADVQ